MTAVTSKHLLDAVHHQCAVGQPGQGVVQCLVVQLAGPWTS